MLSRKRSHKILALASIGLVSSLAVSGCGAGGTGGGGDAGAKEVNVLMVNNPQMMDLQKLTEEHFTEETGIKVNYTLLPENEVRAKISSEFATQAGQYDVATISNYEVPTYARNGWLAPLDDTLANDPEFDQDDILEPMTQSLTGEDGSLYGAPFYGESSFTMYRKDVFEANGLTMPANPTWDEIAALAEKLDGAEEGMAGICLRGQPGWGQIFAPLTTVVNTYGGTWWDEDWNAQVNSPEFVEATQFYVDLIQNHGTSGAAETGALECMNNFMQSKAAMWVDATSLAGPMEAADSPVQGKIGYAASPVKETDSSGWLYTWAFAIEKASPNQEAAVEFIKWASSSEYEELVGEEIGWESVPSGKRASTYENPDYQQSAAAAFYEQARAAIESADPINPGLQPRPAIGIQFVAIPEFADTATAVSQSVSSAIAGKKTVQEALDEGQKLAEEVSEKYQE